MNIVKRIFELLLVVRIAIGLVIGISSLSNAGKGIGSLFKTVILFYIFSTLIASIVAVLGSYAFPIKVVLSGTVEQNAPNSLSDFFGNLLSNMVINPLACVTKRWFIR